MPFDRAAILRAAHAVAKYRMTANRAWRSYRQAFADALRQEWARAKRAAAQAQVEAEEAAAVPLPAEVVEQAAALRLEALYAPHSFAGHTRFRALLAEAEQLERAAQLMMIPAQGSRHVAL